ncbi:MAG: FAD-binding oxidoreductase [Saprospiraceae bacterium]|nr:FAD-binding oxidoreductase [Saprospiraceae bacterium]
MHLSYWEKQELSYPNQIAIVGSGIVGITTAIYIKRNNPDIPVIVVERGQLPLGASTKNAGFSCFGSVSEVLDDLGHMSEDEVIKLIRNRYNGLQRLLSLVSTDEIEYFNNGGYEIFTQDQSELFQSCTEQINYCSDLVSEATGNKNAYQLINTPYGLNTKERSIYNPFEGQLNPMKLMKALITIAMESGVMILNGINVHKIDGHKKELLCNNDVKVPYKKLVICTNGFAKNLFNELDLKTVRNQVLMTEPIEGLQLKGCYHYNKGYVYFRDYHGRILLGGGRDIALEEETTDEFGLTDKIQNFLKSFLYEIIGINKNIKIDHWWSGILGVGSSKSTIIKEYREDHFIGVRMGGMGVALGSEVGYKLASMVVMK